MMPRLIWRMLLRQRVARPCSLVLFRAGRRRAARIAIMEMTTSNSTKVKPYEPSDRRERRRRASWVDSRIWFLRRYLDCYVINTPPDKFKQALFLPLIDTCRVVTDRLWGET